MKYVIPVIFICIILIAAIKKVNVFSAFTKGAGGAVEFVYSLLPLLACTFIMCELFERSSLSQMLTKLLSPVFNFFGVPEQLTKLILIKPFSGSGSLAYLTGILKEYGADSYIGRCAAVLYGSSETVFYVSVVYFSASKQKKRIIPIIIILCATLISTIISCLLCRIM